MLKRIIERNWNTDVEEMESLTKCALASFNMLAHKHVYMDDAQKHSHELALELFLPGCPYLSCRPYIFILAQKEMFESLFKGDVAQSVAGRIDGAVDVAQPVTDSPHGVGDAAGAEGVNEHHDVVRCPGGYKRYQDGHNGARDFFLP